ncbi:hypothetical protein [Amphritea sp.]|uniref:hypothetical protein n=1 Tax=Amphritea sp. TaxID=1872502 RepID=UPI0025B9C7E7|nr:hypothetical protein [Amphritea sp.]
MSRKTSLSVSVLLTTTILSACTPVKPPVGMENDKAFSQEADISYKQAFRIISKQMKACYAGKGLFGNGYDVYSEIDSHAKEARVEVYYVGFAGAEKPEDSMFSRTVTIKQRDHKTLITTTGTTPDYIYLTHATIPTWLRGKTTCSP